MKTDREDILSNIFSRATSPSPIFNRTEVLRSDYVPERLPFRERQIATIGEVLSPILRGSKPSNLLLYGKTGTGKTAVVRYVMGRLQESSGTSAPNFLSTYSNARLAGTEYRVLASISDDLGLDVPFTGLALRELSQRILKHISSTSKNLIMVLDEVDYLVKNSGDDLLYELTRANERLTGGSVSLIGISNDLKFKEFLDPRVISALGEEETVFPPYTAEELRVILRERADLAFHKGAIQEAAINLCAALAASEHGDARRAVDLLRVSAEIADREGSLTVDETHIRLALQKIDQDRMTEALSSLPIHQKLILICSVPSQRDSSTTGEIFLRYTSTCRRLAMEPLTQRRVSGLLNELNMLGLVSASTVSHGRYGRTKRVTTLVDANLIQQVCGGDPLLETLFSSKEP